MVFHITNYMRETNVWMIRKCRWLFWGGVMSTVIYRNTYWDYLGRRVAWKERLGWYGDDDEKMKFSKKWKADWGYVPRYVPAYDFSIKARKRVGETDA